MATTEPSGSAFTFQPLEKGFASLAVRENKELLHKWSASALPLRDAG